MACPEVARVIQIAAADAADRSAHKSENLVVVNGRDMTWRLLLDSSTGLVTEVTLQPQPLDARRRCIAMSDVLIERFRTLDPTRPTQQPPFRR